MHLADCKPGDRIKVWINSGSMQLHKVKSSTTDMQLETTVIGHQSGYTLLAWKVGEMVENNAASLPVQMQLSQFVPLENHAAQSGYQKGRWARERLNRVRVGLGHNPYYHRTTASQRRVGHGV